MLYPWAAPLKKRARNIKYYEDTHQQTHKRIGSFIRHFLNLWLTEILGVDCFCSVELLFDFVPSNIRGNLKWEMSAIKYNGKLRSWLWIDYLILYCVHFSPVWYKDIFHLKKRPAIQSLIMIWGIMVTSKFCNNI